MYKITENMKSLALDIPDTSCYFFSGVPHDGVLPCQQYVPQPEHVVSGSYPGWLVTTTTTTTTPI